MNKSSRSKKSTGSKTKTARTPKSKPQSVSTPDPQRAAAPPEAVRAARSAAKKAAAKPAVKANAQKTEGNGAGFKKQYLKSRHACKVTFRLPGEAAPEAARVSLVGDFNGWSAEDTPMKKLKDGDFTATMELEQGRDYRFRYLIEGQRWENDWHADRYEPNAFGGDDSVVSC